MPPAMICAAKSMPNWKISTRKTTDYERNLQAGKGDKTKLQAGIRTLKNDRQTLTGFLKQLDQVTATNWKKNEKPSKK
jgi:hypothetical protein